MDFMKIEKIIEEIEPINYKEDLVLALKASKKACEIMEEYTEKGIEKIDEKGKSDILTKADEECQEKIVEIIEDEKPEDGFLAEENDLSETNRRRVWVVDPIDGTFNFSNGFPHYGCSMALRVEKETEVAVVNMPESSLGRTFLAVRDYGAFKVDNEVEKLEVSNQNNFREAMVQVSMAERYPSLQKANIELMKKLLDEGATIRRQGAAAIDLCLVASGALDSSFHRCFDWDYAAGKLIVEEAGGKFWLNQRSRDLLTECMAGNEEFLEKKLEEYEQVKRDTGVIFKGKDE